MSAAADDVARFARELARLWPEGERDARLTLGLAVSGGPDSLAMLLLAALAWPGRVAAATVDHGLRPQSADEAAAVAGICAGLAVPHATLAVEVGPGNLQSQARTARYDVLGGWMADAGIGALATAHHADDQAETLILRLNRGSGVAGLAGARARGRVPGSDRLLLRPLLGWRRAELARIVECAGIAAAQDPSNSDDRFDRARLRKDMAGAPWLDVGAIAASAGHLADADAALDWAARREWNEAVARDGLGMRYVPRAPRAVALRVIARLVAEMDGEAARGSALARVFDSLAAGQPASIGALVARPMAQGWFFTRAPKRR